MSISFANQYTASVGAATTAAVVATNGVAAGDLLVIEARVVTPCSMVSIDVGGTLLDSGVRASAAGNRGNMVAAYVLSASTVNAGATITITFSANHGGAKVNIRDYTVSGGTAALDAVTDLSSNNLSDPANQVTGPSALTLTGTGDVVIQAANAWNGSSEGTISAVDGLWVDTAFSTAGFADQVGISSFSAPNWTSGTRTIKSTLALAFGFTPTPASYVSMIDFSAGVAGNAPTAADLESSTFGAASITSPNISAGDPRYWQVVTPGTYLTYNASAHHALNGSAPRFAVSGTTYSDGGSLGLQYDTSGTGATRYARMFFPWGNNYPGAGVSPTAMATCFFRTSLSGTDTVNMDVFGIFGTGTGSSNFCNAVLHSNGAIIRMELEGTVDAYVTISPNTWYQLALLWDRNATGKLMVFSEDGTTQIGTTQTIAQHATAYPLYVYFGDFNGSPVTTGKTIWWDKVKVFFLGNTPAYPILDILPAGGGPLFGQGELVRGALRGRLFA